INKKYEIEVKKQFDLVLEELHIFNGIGQENENSLSHGERDILETKFISLKHSDSIPDYSKAVCENKVNTTFSTLTTMNYSTMAKQNKKNEQSLFKDKPLERPGEKEAPHECCSPSTSHEELYYSSSKEQCDLHCTQAFPWNPASAPHTFMKKENYCLQMERENPLLHGIIRVQPLKTCRGPLRVGLSRKAKPKHLHPYLKMNVEIRWSHDMF
ncbi:RAD51-associated protein 2, partial [Varanus komodoensis]